MLTGMFRILRESTAILMSLLASTALHFLLMFLAFWAIIIVTRKGPVDYSTILLGVYLPFAAAGAIVSRVQGFKFPTLFAPLGAALILVAPLVVGLLLDDDPGDQIRKIPGTYYFALPAISSKIRQSASGA